MPPKEARAGWQIEERFGGRHLQRHESSQACRVQHACRPVLVEIPSGVSDAALVQPSFVDGPLSAFRPS